MMMMLMMLMFMVVLIMVMVTMAIMDDGDAGDCRVFSRSARLYLASHCAKRHRPVLRRSCPRRLRKSNMTQHKI